MRGTRVCGIDKVRDASKLGLIESATVTLAIVSPYAKVFRRCESISARDTVFTLRGGVPTL